MEKGVWTVAEWFTEKVKDQARAYSIYVASEYTNDNMADATKLRVDEVLAESEKAYKVNLEAETMSGKYKPWTCWIPKSVIKEG